MKIDHLLHHFGFPPEKKKQIVRTSVGKLAKPKRCFRLTVDLQKLMAVLKHVWIRFIQLTPIFFNRLNLPHYLGRKPGALPQMTCNEVSKRHPARCHISPWNWMALRSRHLNCWVLLFKWPTYLFPCGRLSRCLKPSSHLICLYIN